jgi:N-methylhydantoinase B/oxoprolinase/acetone carboxylase alpha subunit
VLAGGGGLSDPQKRDPALVAEHVRSGIYTPQHAQTVLGVDVGDLAVR